MPNGWRSTRRRSPARTTGAWRAGDTPRNAATPPAAAGTAATYTVTHAFLADGNIATAAVNGATTASKTVVLDTNVGTIAVGDVVTGTGITGSPSGIVRVQTVASQTNIDLDTAVTLANDAVLTFDGTDKLFVGQLDVSKTIATGDIFRINSGNLSIELK